MRRNIGIILIMILGIAVSMITAVFKFKYYSSYPAVNKARYETKNALDYVEDNFKNKNFKYLNKFNFKTMILDIHGNVLYNNSVFKLSGGSLKESVSYDMNFSDMNPDIIKFSSPVEVNGSQAGNAVFFIKKNFIIKNSLKQDIILIFLPIFIALGIISIILFYGIYTDRKQIINPIVALNSSAKAIIRGNFDVKINYNSNTEIGKLCANFEKMRDELKDSIERERRIEDSRKEIITCISHDLRTPIASIKAYVDGIMDGIAKDKNTVFRYLSVIEKKTRVLTKLINDLFEHCQIELHKLSIDKKEIYSGDFLNSISDEMRLEFKNSSHKFKASEHMPNVLINIDALRIEQVIYNLVQNAVKYTPEEGTIMFEAEIEDDYLKISVKDNGYGIDYEDMPFIFDKFYRGEKTRNSDRGGSGLGLSICKYIVEKHGGQIFVQSKKNKGTNFYFVLPKL